MREVRHGAFASICLILAFTFLASPVHGYSFTVSTLKGHTLRLTTSLQFGPDDRLYAAQKNGDIKAFTVQRVGPNDYQTTATETITLVRLIPNYNDNGTRNSAWTTRLMTGLVVTGTAASPIIYATSSDPREGGGSSVDNDTGLDTNSGIISRLRKNGSTWEKVDLVRGLPRSEENHVPNGLQYDAANHRLFVAIGGNTNAGGPSHNLAYLPETALSAAIIVVDLAAIEALPVKTDAFGQNYIYDLPTLDDPNPNRARNPDGSNVNDPFGGHDGLNQAKLEPGGPVQLYATGFRNAYDLVLTQTPGRAGRLYAFDNGANPGWGGYPKNEGPAGNVTNEYVTGEPGSVNNRDSLHFVSGPGYYGGHPNPIRANPGGAGWLWFDNDAPAGTQMNFSLSPTTDWPPVPLAMANPVEGDFRLPGPANGALVTNPESTNGISEYIADNFEGALRGSLLAVDLKGSLLRIALSEDGTSAPSGLELLAANFGITPLDVTTPRPGAGGPFTGTIWIAHHSTSGQITILEPTDFDSGGGSPCSGIHSYEVDEDGDGYSNGDEIDAGSNPCSPSIRPADYDDDKISDLNDPDDDNDGIPDLEDVVPLDPLNGASQPIPGRLDLYNTSTGFFNVGFTGLMVNPGENYTSRYFPEEIVAGGTAGLFTIPNVGPGTALGAANTQDNAFLFAVPSSAVTSRYVIRCGLGGPFFNSTPQGNQSHGFFLGIGDQDNYVKVAIHANDGAGAVEVVHESGGSVLTRTLHPVADLLTANVVDLYLVVDPALGTVQPQVRAQGAANPTNLGPALMLDGEMLSAVNGLRPLAVGAIATTGDGSAPSFGATWDDFELSLVPSTARAQVTVDSGAGSILTSSTYTANAFTVQNTSTGGQTITQITFDLSSALLPDVVFDPNGTAGDTASKGFSLNTNSGVATVSGTFGQPHNGSSGADGYDVLTINTTGFDAGDLIRFSADIDPTSIKGAADPGPNNSGSVSGLELIGATVTVLFNDGSVHRTRLSRIPNSVRGSEGAVVAQKPQPPLLSVAGATPPFATNAPVTLRLAGPPGASALIYSFEAGLYTAGVPDDGYDLDPFEANTVLSVAQQSVTIPESGVALVPFTLLRTSAEAGYNLFTATLVGADGVRSPVSDVITIYAEPTGGGDTQAPTTPGNLAASNVTSTSLTLTWSASTDNVGVTGYRVSRNGSAVATITTLTYSDSGLTPATSYAYSVVALDAAGNASTPATLSVTTAPGGGSGTSLRRINAGGSAYTDSTGQVWEADNSYNTGLVATNSNAIAGTVDDPLYRSERYDSPSGANLIYNLAVANGSYLLNLHFAETHAPSAVVGGRVFDVHVEGQLAIDDLDIFARVGANAALVIGVPATVTDGALTIEFRHGTQNPKINAIEIRAADSEPPTAVTQLRTTSVTSDAVSLAWNAATDNVGVTGYRVSRDGALLATVTELSYADTGLSPGINYTYSVVAEDAAGNRSSAATLTVTTTAGGGGPGEVLRRINAGGSAFTDSVGQLWDADSGYNTGLVARNSNAIAGTVDDALYRSERYDSPSGPSLIYSFPAPNGAYTVNLHFAETHAASAVVGGRVFDVYVEGQLAIDDLDIFARVGANTALVLSVPTTVNDGAVTIEFRHGVQNPKINAIEVLASGGAGSDTQPPSTPGGLAASNVTATSVTLAWSASTDNVGVTGYRVSRDGAVVGTVTTLSYADAGLSPATTYAYSVVALDAAGNASPPATLNVSTANVGGSEETVWRINSGGPNHVDASGNSWTADAGYNTGLVATNNNAIAGTVDDKLYQSERYDPPSGPRLVYSLAVPNGTYSVRLHFAETHAASSVVGGRVFDVKMEGTLVIDDLDIFSRVGANTALVITVPVTVSDGQLTIEFLPGVQNPKINAIHVVHTSS